MNTNLTTSNSDTCADVLKLIGRVSSLNPDAGEIGDGMLRQLVGEARRLLSGLPPEGFAESLIQSQTIHPITTTMFTIGKREKGWVEFPEAIALQLVSDLNDAPLSKLAVYGPEKSTDYRRESIDDMIGWVSNIGIDPKQEVYVTVEPFTPRGVTDKVLKYFSMVNDRRAKIRPMGYGISDDKGLGLTLFRHSHFRIVPN